MGARQAILVAVATAAAVSIAVVSAARGTAAAALDALAQAGSTQDTCSPSDTQYQGCWGGPQCTIYFSRPIHFLDIPPTAPPDLYAAAWEGDAITATTGSSCEGVVITAVTWYRDGVPVAPGVHYVVVAADVGRQLSARITIDDVATGPHTVVKTIVLPVEYAAPVQLTGPTIIGTPTVGAVLTATPGTWQLTGSDPGPLHYTFCWMPFWPFTTLPEAGGKADSLFCFGQPSTSSAYLVTPAVLGHPLYVAVYAYGAGGTSEVVYFAKTGPVTP